MNVASFLVILLVINAVAENVPGDLFKPAYFDVQLDRIEQLYSDLEYCDWSGLKVRKVNKTRSIIGEIKFFKPFGNDIMTEGKAYKKQGNEYRLLPFHLPQEPYCDIAVRDIYIYPDMAKGSDLPEDVMANCPLTPGTYKFRNVVLALDMVPKRIAPSGDYAVEIVAYKGEKLILKARIYVSVVQV